MDKRGFKIPCGSCRRGIKELKEHLIFLVLLLYVLKNNIVKKAIEIQGTDNGKAEEKEKTAKG